MMGQGSAHQYLGQGGGKWQGDLGDPGIWLVKLRFRDFQNL